MNIGNAENVQKLVEFYVNNAAGLANNTNVEVDTEIKIRVIPNFDKNIEGKFVIVGSGKIVLPGKEEGLFTVNDDDAAPENNEETKDAEEPNLKVVNPE